MRVKKKRKWKDIDWRLYSNWIGVRVRGKFLVPALTCNSNGRKAQFEGEVVGVRSHKYMGQCFQVEEEPGEEENLLVRMGEITHRLHGRTWVCLIARENK